MGRKQEVLLNCMEDGMFAFSDEFKAHAEQHMDELRADFDEVDAGHIDVEFEDYDDVVRRSAPSLVQMVKAFGLERSGDPDNCALKIAKVDKLLLKYATVDQDDCETDFLIFDTERYWKRLCKKDMPAAERAAKMSRFVAAKKRATRVIGALGKVHRRYGGARRSASSPPADDRVQGFAG